MDQAVAQVKSTVIGLAKDGRVIYGPLKSNDGAFFTACDLDACNGRREVDTSGVATGVYSYRASTFHPYLVGCFGPSANQSSTVLGQTCSENDKFCSGFSLSLTGQLTQLTLLLVAFHALFLS